MRNLFKKIILIFLSIPGNPLKEAIRDVFYGDVLSERIFEYAAVFRNLNKEPDKKVKILDVGCYYSNFPLQLSSLGYSVTAIDLQDYTLTHPNFNFILGDITKYNFNGKKFDIVTCISTLEHIGLGVYGGDLEKRGDRMAIEAINRVLKKGGRLILTFPFGKSTVTPTYRSYSTQDLDFLLKGFSVKNVYFYRRVKGKWLKTTRREISTVKNKKEVNGVGVIIVEKK